MKIAAFILHTGQNTLPDARRSLETQIGDVRVYSTIRPVNRAIQRVFDDAVSSELDWFLVMGADTVHKKDSIETLLSHAGSTLWSVFGRLNDYWRGSDGYGNHFYRTEAIRGYKVPQDDPLYDRTIHADMEKRGFKKLVTEDVIGKHHPVWTPQEAFEKHLFSGRRYEGKDQRHYYNQVKYRANEFPHPVTAAALEGYELGMATQDKRSVLTHEPTREWELVKHRFADITLEW